MAMFPDKILIFSGSHTNGCSYVTLKRQCVGMNPVGTSENVCFSNINTYFVPFSFSILQPRLRRRYPATTMICRHEDKILSVEMIEWKNIKDLGSLP
jgi:hypothetical protein